MLSVLAPRFSRWCLSPPHERFPPASPDISHTYTQTPTHTGTPQHTGRRALPPEDPVLVVARTAAANTHLLCLDELHVTDVADAMLLSRLFGELLRCGCWVVFTSNRPARDLYRGGLSRRYFEPFVELVDDR